MTSSTNHIIRTSNVTSSVTSSVTSNVTNVTSSVTSNVTSSVTKKPVKHQCKYCDLRFSSKYVRDIHEKERHITKQHQSVSSSKFPAANTQTPTPTTANKPNPPPSEAKNGGESGGTNIASYDPANFVGKKQQAMHQHAQRNAAGRGAGAPRGGSMG